MLDMMMRKMSEQTKGMIMKMKMPEQTTMDHRWARCRTLIFKSCFSSRKSCCPRESQAGSTGDRRGYSIV